MAIQVGRENAAVSIAVVQRIPTNTVCVDNLTAPNPYPNRKVWGTQYKKMLNWNAIGDVSF